MTRLEKIEREVASLSRKSLRAFASGSRLTTRSASMTGLRPTPGRASSTTWRTRRWRISGPDARRGFSHHATPAFWSAYAKLTEAVRELADCNFALLEADPAHPSLRFKSVGRFWSARVGLRYCALAVRKGDDAILFWIGSRADYDRLIG